MNDLLRHKWYDLLVAWGVDRMLGAAAFEDICKHYSTPGRFYHTLDHIGAMLVTVDSLASFAQNLNTVKLAVWLHDLIYDSRASDNEVRSAEYAEECCSKLAIPVHQLVSFLILKTKTHEAGGDPDAQVLLDADLAILGASELPYCIYADQIRMEYAWVPEPDYRKGRRQFLEGFLARPRIFHLLIHLEESARRNMAGEITRLSDSAASKTI
jgi:predicted metal-dependent HD superfamily phosphohydrolase